MSEHAVIFKRTELIYVYDSDDEKIRNRRERRKKNLEKKKKNRLRVRNRCETCGYVIQNNSCIKLDNATFICLACAVEISGI